MPLLEDAGLSVKTVDLPSVDADPDPAADLARDAAAVRAVLDQTDGSILLVGHSYGGMVITEAATDSAGTSRLVYLCAFMPEQGQSLFDITGGPAPWIEARADGTVLPFADQTAAVFYADRQPGDAALGRRPSQADAARAVPSADGLGGMARHSVDVCRLWEDMALPPELQRDLFAPRAGEVIVLSTSHSPFLSQPEALAELIADRA